MRSTAAHTTVTVHMEVETGLEVNAFEPPANGYGRAFVSISLGDCGGMVAVLVRNVAALDRLVESVADARTALLRVTRETDARQPELLAS